MLSLLQDFKQTNGRKMENKDSAHVFVQIGIVQELQPPNPSKPSFQPDAATRNISESGVEAHEIAAANQVNASALWLPPNQVPMGKVLFGAMKKWEKTYLDVVHLFALVSRYKGPLKDRLSRLKVKQLSIFIHWDLGRMESPRQSERGTHTSNIQQYTRHKWF